jgi:hypothetical protein
MVQRRKHRRLADPNTLAGMWDAMLPPPPIADEDREELWDLVFFGSDANPIAEQHPHYRAWLAEALKRAPRHIAVNRNCKQFRTDYTGKLKRGRVLKAGSRGGATP